MKLNGKSIVVTGASSGMGKAIVERFAKEGANIIAVARRKERLDELAASLKDAPGKVVPFVGVVSKEETMVSAIDLAVKEFGRLDVLVNNAGIMDDMSPIGDVKNEKIDQVFAVNVYGPMYSMRKASQVFLEQGDGGNIINVASFGAIRTAAGAVYGASKAALGSLAKNTAYMYMPNGIRCNAIAPGFLVSAQNKALLFNDDGTPTARSAKILGGTPTGRFVDADELIGATLFLCDDKAASAITGVVLPVDAGFAAYSGV